ncbi:DegT/DnrJ/EryC1/StrS aminotransferase family protein [Blastococcus sp. Marseille-P5729]|uniref:DegT/DnrJ/EryC1/StrS family aminotransferase n=1 Tax=Blastococcus sp. Marseille-P5729 TaxID=2086582 RepID=UPI000D0E4510|nr:DegT/DnrJ/EryC1/StrS family aminotransferase [Blastococcus sp. Marseille-P5729]
MSDTVALGQPTVGQEELDAIADVFKSGWIAGNGPTSRRFEAAFSAATASEHTLATSNCTTALQLAFHCLGAGAGDEVLVADYTFPATGHAVMHTGATPVFVDVLPDTACIDPQALEAAITDRTVGIAAVDYAGQTADFDLLERIASKHGLWLGEDAAPAAGAMHNGRPAGSFGDAGCFSFHGRKGITSGEGGALTTSHADLDAKARKLHAFGIESALSRAASNDLPIPQFDELGFNYKLSDIAAAIMLVQLERMPTLIANRTRVAERYSDELADNDLVTLPVTRQGNVHVWQAYTLTLDPTVHRGELARMLREQGIQCNIGTYASHLQPLYGFAQQCPVSADLFERHFTIPMHANLRDDEIERVLNVLKTSLPKARA